MWTFYMGQVETIKQISSYTNNNKVKNHNQTYGNTCIEYGILLLLPALG